MSVLIRGMEMPKGCSECRFAVDGWCYAYGKPNVDALSDKGRTNWCPLVPVPLHGRLIDADALTRKILEECGKFEAMNQYDSGLRAGYRASTKAVRLAPTIISAEEDE